MSIGRPGDWSTGEHFYLIDLVNCYARSCFSLYSGYSLAPEYGVSNIWQVRVPIFLLPIMPVTWMRLSYWQHCRYVCVCACGSLLPLITFSPGVGKACSSAYSSMPSRSSAKGLEALP